MINQLGVKVVSIGFIFDVHKSKQHPKANTGTVPHAKLNNYVSLITVFITLLFTMLSL